MAIESAEKLFSVSELAAKLDVSTQRVHALIKSYGIEVRKLADGRLFLIPESEIGKIPKSRPNGVRRNPSKKTKK